MSEQVRLSIPIPKELHDELDRIFPWGVKAQIVRELLVLVVKGYRDNQYIMEDLLKNRVQLVRSKFEQDSGSET